MEPTPNTGGAAPVSEQAMTWLAGLFPIDGPHDPQRVAAAGLVLAAAARYLAHATAHPGLGVATVYSLLGSLVTGLGSAEQVCRQLTRRLTDLAADASLRADQLGPPASAAGLAAQAAAMTSVTVEDLAVTAAWLADAHTATGRLYQDQG